MGWPKGKPRRKKVDAFTSEDGNSGTDATLLVSPCREGDDNGNGKNRGKKGNQFGNKGLKGSKVLNDNKGSTEVRNGITNEIEMNNEDVDESVTPCDICSNLVPESDIIICDGCECEFHMKCLKPPLSQVPEGDWHCNKCKDSSLLAVDENNVQKEPNNLESRDKKKSSCEVCGIELEVSNDLHSPQENEGNKCRKCERMTKRNSVEKRQNRGSKRANSLEIKSKKRVSKKRKTPLNVTCITCKLIFPQTQKIEMVDQNNWKCDACNKISDNDGVSTLYMAKLIICDRCDGEFDMLQLDPPLTTVPKGDWFCMSCNPKKKKKSSKSNFLKGGVITCCNCHIGFDMQTLDRSLTTPPKGDWFCADCRVINKNASPSKDSVQCSACEKEVSRTDVSNSSGGLICLECVSKNDDGGVEGVALSQLKNIPMSRFILCCGCCLYFDMKIMGIEEIPVDDWYCKACDCGYGDLIICDRCENEFEIALLDPPLKSIPEGNWYCKSCSSRKKSGRKSRKSLSNMDESDDNMKDFVRPPPTQEEVRAMNRCVGKRVHIYLEKDDQWYKGRVMKLNPCNGKHLIRYDDDQDIWCDLRDFPHMYGKDLVWAKLRGHPWWPAQTFQLSEDAWEVMGADSDRLKEKSFVIFFGDFSQAFVLKGSIKSFSGYMELATEVKQEKKKSKIEAAINLAIAEEDMITSVLRIEKQEIVKHHQSKLSFNDWIDKRVVVPRPDVNYPDGANCEGVVKKYSESSKKHLIVYDNPSLQPCWTDIKSANVTLFVKADYKTLASTFFLGKARSSTRGWQDDKQQSSENGNLVNSSGKNDKKDDNDLLATVENLDDISDGEISPPQCDSCGLRNKDPIVVCTGCAQTQHIYCADPPLKKVPKKGYSCLQCTCCSGCGVETSNKQPGFMWNYWQVDSKDVALCDNCIEEYGKQQFCPSCLKVWGASDCGTMICCDTCDMWVHASCDGLTQEEYDEITKGTHSIWGKSYHCFICRRNLLCDTLEKLRVEDKMFIFSEPVTLDIAPTYFQVIKHPIDLQTMREKAEADDYSTPQQLRDDFELLCLNAVTFNPRETKIWKEAWRYYKQGLQILQSQLLVTHPGKYSEAILNLEQKQIPRKRVSTNNTLANIKLPPLGTPPKPTSVLIPLIVYITRPQASSLAWLDMCFLCGSTGTSEKMIFCIDCGECFHSCCMNPPLKLTPMMQNHWRCSNCKICEKCGSCTPEDEHRLLVCDICDRGFHTFCLSPKLSTIPSGKWICGSCVDCNQCHRPQNMICWSQDPSLCHSCATIEKMKKKNITIKENKPFAETCPVCLLRWDANENLIQCDYCRNWMHPACDGMDYNQFVALANDMEGSYYCPSCRNKNRQISHLGKTREAGSLFVSIGKIQATRRDLIRQWDRCCSVERELGLWQKWDAQRSSYQCVILSGRKRIEEVAMLPRFQNDHKVEPVPEWIKTRASRFIRSQAFSRGPRVKKRLQQLPQRHITAVVSEAMAAAAFLATTNAMYNLESISEFTKRLLVVPIFGKPLSVEKPPDSKETEPLSVEKPPDNKESIGVEIDGNSQSGSGSKEVTEDQKKNQQENSTLSVEPLLPQKIAEIPSTTTENGVESSLQQHEGKGGGDTTTSSGMVAQSINSDQLANENNIPVVQVKTEAAAATNVVKTEAAAATTNVVSGLDKVSLDKVSSSLVPNVGKPMRVECPKPYCGWGKQHEDTLGVYKDLRQCGFCRQHGNHRVSGRLIPVDFDQWVHVNCALWSSEVYEDMYGSLMSWYKARSRSRTMKCSLCNGSGATIGCCTPKCPSNYHFDCAKESGCVFLESKEVYCSIEGHQPQGDLKLQRVLEPYRFVVAAPSPVEYQSKKSKNGKCFRIGSLTVHSLGNVVAGQDSFHRKECIFPVGFRSTRIYWSAKRVRRRCLYECEILYASDVCQTRHAPPNLPEQGPCFRITPADDMSNPILAASPEDAVRTLRERIIKLYITNDLREYAGHPLCNRTSWQSYGLFAGHFIGYSVPEIAKAIEELPHASVAAISPDDRTPYRFCYTLPTAAMVQEAQEYQIAAAAVAEQASQSSGCARTDGWTHHKKHSVAPKRSGVSKQASVDKNDAASIEDRRMVGDLPLPMQYRELRRKPFSERVEVLKSRIHGYGLFVKETIAMDKMIVEYQGQAVRQKVADEREKRYEQMGVGSCYMFRLDSNTILDATRTGNLARFINHSCDPNAYAKIVEVDGKEKKIIIFAKRDLICGEEVTYDYKFPIEEEAIRCDCGSINCVGRMN